MNFILAAVLSNLSYAFADNANGLLSKKNKPLAIAFWATAFGILIFFIPAITIFSSELSRITPTNLAIMLAINILVNVGYLSFITGMNKGSVTLTGVIGGSFPAVTTVAALVFFGESVTMLQAVAIVIVLVGVALSSMHGRVKDLIGDLHKSGAIFAFGAFFFWGIYFALVRIPIQEIGWFLPQYTSSFVGIVMFWLLSLHVKDKSVTKRPNMVWLIAVTAFLQVAGSMLFNYAISQGQTAIVAPIAGSSPAVFVIIAHFLFRERLNRKQWAGILLALSGIVSLALFSN